MKLASLKHGRDGRLVVVSDDLQWCTDAAPVAQTLQAALDNWAIAEPKLRAACGELAQDRRATSVSMKPNARRPCRARFNGRMDLPM